jgi:hypothetical protein
LKKNFNLNSRIEEKVKSQWVIYIPVKQEIPVKTIVMPYMVDSMLYKINLNAKPPGPPLGGPGDFKSPHHNVMGGF